MFTTRILTAAFALSTLLGTACVSGDGDSKCSGKCDGDGVDELLSGRGDPIAKWLRTQNIGDDLVVTFDYGDVVRGVADVQGCGESSWGSYVVSDPLVEDIVFPRVVSTVCSDNLERASEFFIAASFKHPFEEDIDPQRLEMFAWDPDTAEYRFYAVDLPEDDPDAEEFMLEVDPARCADCHQKRGSVSTDGMPMTPIMNELTAPWAHWNSQVPMFNPDDNPFRSHTFDVPEQVRTADFFTAYAVERVGPAANLEQVIRSGQARVASQRARTRRDRPEDWRPAMNLLRPIFCEEQINFTTEDFDTGLIAVTALIPGGIREAYIQIRPDNWAWNWLNNQDARIRLPGAQSIAPLFMVPVRGNADIDYENRLLTGKALDPRQILQVKSLDWKQPVFSEFRCDLWSDALARFEQQAPEFDLSSRNSARMKVLFDEIMKIDGLPLVAPTEGRIITMDRASDANVSALREALAGTDSCQTDGSGVCDVDVDELGEMLNQYIGTFVSGDADTVRAALRAERDSRLCTVLRDFENAPALPQLTVGCPDSGGGGNEPAGSFGGDAEPGAPIPDNDGAGLSHSISVEDSFGVDRVEVALDISHTWRGDLVVELTSPGGDTREVVAFESSDSQADVQGTFSIDDFSGGAAGAWRLSVVDRAAQDTGTLNRWSIGINTTAP